MPAGRPSPPRRARAGGTSARWRVAVERQRGRVAPLWVGVVPKALVDSAAYCTTAADGLTNTCNPSLLAPLALPGTVCTGYACAGSASFASTDE